MRFNLKLSHWAAILLSVLIVSTVLICPMSNEARERGNGLILALFILGLGVSFEVARRQDWWRGALVKATLQAGLFIVVLLICALNLMNNSL